MDLTPENSRKDDTSDSLTDLQFFFFIFGANLFGIAMGIIFALKAICPGSHL